MPTNSHAGENHPGCIEDLTEAERTMFESAVFADKPSLTFDPKSESYLDGPDALGGTGVDLSAFSGPGLLDPTSGFVDRPGAAPAAAAPMFVVEGMAGAGHRFGSVAAH